MRKSLIYIISLVIGLIVGFLLYSLVRYYLPVTSKEKINYDEYTEIVDNFHNIKSIKYGDIVVENDNNFILVNSFLSLENIDLNSKSISFSKEDFVDNIYNLFGSVTYKLNDFSYEYSFYSGECEYKESDELYICVTDNDFMKKKTEFNYDVVDSYYDKNGNIIIKSRYYYSLPFCEGLEDSVCLYKDEKAKHLIVRCREDEIMSHSLHFDIITFIYKRANDNKLYLKEIKW